MNRLSALLLTVVAAIALLSAACGGSDDGGDGGETDSSPTQAAESTAETDGEGSSGSGDGAANTDGDFFQVSGSGVLTVEVDGETYEFDVTCQADKGMTFDDEPQWDYSLESSDPDLIVQGTYQLVDDEETFKSLSIVGSELTISASEFSNVTSGGTEWAGSFTSAGLGGPIEGTFETSCS